MFTTPCFIRKNTPELRLELERIGYIHGKPSNYNDDDNIYDFIICFENKYYLLSQCNYTIREGHPLKKYGSIDCGTNESLFLAISALRDDSDYMQWFTNSKEVILCDKEDWIDMYSSLCCGKGSDYQYELDKYHKMSVDELKEHFKE